jgi:hypothetical protein
MSDTLPTACLHTRTAVDRNQVPPPHYGKIVCLDCGAHIGWAKQPLTRERAERYRMQAGKYMGMRLDQIARKDRAYLEWVADNWDGLPNLRRIVRHYLNTH